MEFLNSFFLMSVFSIRGEHYVHEPTIVALYEGPMSGRLAGLGITIGFRASRLFGSIGSRSRPMGFLVLGLKQV